MNVKNADLFKPDQGSQLLDGPLSFAANVNSLSSFETEMPYEYYTMPFCKPPEGVKRAPNTANPGTILQGLRIENSPYNFTMKVRNYDRGLIIGLHETALACLGHHGDSMRPCMDSPVWCRYGSAKHMSRNGHSPCSCTTLRHCGCAGLLPEACRHQAQNGDSCQCGPNRAPPFASITLHLRR